MPRWSDITKGVVLMLAYVLFIVLIVVLAETVNATDDGKYDGPCAGTETVGRCADKRGAEPLIEPVPAPAVPQVMAEIPANIGGMK